MTSSAAKENSITAYDPCGGAESGILRGGRGRGAGQNLLPRSMCSLYLRLTQAGGGGGGGWEKSLSGREGMYRTDREKSM